MQAADLEHSAKNRAENVMIVDMVRNDLGRIAETGSVQVSRLCEVERYTTVWQMTSTVSTCTRASHTEILSALFPCASITGAPKVRTTEIIAELEQAPRGAYTGAIGYFAPHRRAQFNIAIRTMQVETATGNLEYGIGGGIVWDSTAESEYDEALTKALVLTARWPDFRLLETLLWRPGKGYFLLHEHLRRLQQSAEYFGFRVEMDAVQARLEGESPHEPVPHRVRLLVEEDGEIEIQASPLPTAPAYPWRVTFAPAPINPADPFLYHKTTHRDLYEITRAACQDYDDVLLWNPRGELTESTVANLTACIDGQWLTPPVSCGLLPGVYRDHLLKCDKLTEAVITRAMLAEATAIALVNSVRGWIPAVLAPASITDSTEESR